MTSGRVMYSATLLIAADIVSSRLQGGSLRLFASPHVIDAGDNLALYESIKASFGGYAAQTVNDWGTPYLNGLNQAESDAGGYSFTPTGSGLPQTIYGWYFLDSSGNLMFAQPDPFGGTTLSVVGVPYIVQPRWVDFPAS